MRFLKRKRAFTPLADIMTKKVLLLVDWENLFFNLFTDFGAQNMDITFRLKKMLAWIQGEIGEIFGDYGFVFAPEHLSLSHQRMCVNNNMKLVICPKRQLRTPKKDPKTGRMITEEDTVDETIIWFGKTMMRHPDVKFICLVSGDDDYVPLFEEAERYSIKRVLIPPTLNSLSKSKRLVRLADKHPISLKRMILRLDTL